MRNAHIFCIRSPSLSGKGDQVIYHQRCEQLSAIDEIKSVHVYCMDKAITQYNPPSRKVFAHYVRVNLISRMVFCLALLLFDRQAIQSSIFFSKAFIDIAKKIDDRDLVIVGTVRLYYLLKFVKSKLCILDMIDVISETYSQLDKRSENFLKRQIYSFEAKRLRELERRAALSNKFNFLVSEIDKNAEHLRGGNLFVIPIMSKGLKPLVNRSSPRIHRNFTLGFHGNLDYFPNVEACHFIMKKIMPQLPDGPWKFLCAGRRPSTELRSQFRHKNHYAELIESPSDIYSIVGAYDLYIAPIFSGAGMQNKLLEAAEMMVPIITTKKASLPLGFEHGKHCLVADSSEEFCAAICRLHNSTFLAEYLVGNAQELIESRYSLEATVNLIKNITKI